MKLLILITFVSFCYCSNKEEVKNEEKRIAGGGNYGGFIGLTTYGGGPFLVKGKFDSDLGSSQGYEDGGQEGVTSNKDISKNDKLKDYEDTSIGRADYGEKGEADLEDLGYAGDGCIGQFENINNYGSYRNRDKYGRQRNRNENRSNQASRNYSTYYDEATRDRCDYVFGYTGPTANDEPENLMRPCALDDWQCIRKFFAANSNCKPAYGPIPDPLQLDINTAFYPVANLTVALPNVMIRGLSSAKIRDFYVNKVSGNLVFAIDVSTFNETVPRGYFRYRRTAKESIVLSDYATIEYGPIVFTAVIPSVPKLRLDLADIHPDIQNSLPIFFVGPGASNSTDPDVLSSFAQFSTLLPIVVREGLLFQSQLVTSIYIQKNICDFGLKIISV